MEKEDEATKSDETWLTGVAAPPFRSAPAHVMRGNFKTYIIVDGRHSAERHAVHTHAHGA